MLCLLAVQMIHYIWPATEDQMRGRQIPSTVQSAMCFHVIRKRKREREVRHNAGVNRPLSSSLLSSPFPACIFLWVSKGSRGSLRENCVWGLCLGTVSGNCAWGLGCLVQEDVILNSISGNQRNNEQDITQKQLPLWLCPKWPPIYSLHSALLMTRTLWALVKSNALYWEQGAILDTV